MEQTNSHQINAEVEAFKQAERNRIEQLSKLYSTQEASPLQVSKRTARWVELYQQTQTLFADITDLCECDELKCDIDAIVERELTPTIGKLQDFLMKRIERSIWENLSDLNSSLI